MAAVPIFALLHSISQISIGAARHQITLTTAKPPNAMLELNIAKEIHAPQTARPIR